MVRWGWGVVRRGSGTIDNICCSLIRKVFMYNMKDVLTLSKANALALNHMIDLQGLLIQLISINNDKIPEDISKATQEFLEQSRKISSQLSDMIRTVVVGV